MVVSIIAFMPCVSVLNFRSRLNNVPWSSLRICFLMTFSWSGGTRSCSVLVDVFEAEFNIGLQGFYFSGLEKNLRVQLYIVHVYKMVSVLLVVYGKW